MTGVQTCALPICPRATPSRVPAQHLCQALQRGAPAPKPRARTTRGATTSQSTEPGPERDRTLRSPRWAHPRVLPKGCLNLSIANRLAASPFNRRHRNDPVETRPCWRCISLRGPLRESSPSLNCARRPQRVTDCQVAPFRAVCSLRRNRARHVNSVPVSGRF